jgi:hypothetical protein
VWNLQFQHHDGDYNGDHAVTECLDPAFSHASPLSLGRKIREPEGTRHRFPVQAGETDAGQLAITIAQ